MKASIDFHLVPGTQTRIDGRLVNWARYVRDRPVTWMSPMFRGYQSSEVWLQEKPVPVDQLDGHKMEKAVAALPDKERTAVRWAYVFKGAPWRIRRRLGVTEEGLRDLIVRGRQMLINRVA